MARVDGVGVDTGVLAFPTPRGGSSVGQLTWFNRDGKATGAIEAPTTDDAENLNAVISPTNDSLIAANRLDPQTGTWHVWLIDGSRNNAATDSRQIPRRTSTLCGRPTEKRFSTPQSATVRGNSIGRRLPAALPSGCSMSADSRIRFRVTGRMATFYFSNCTVDLGASSWRERPDSTGGSTTTIGRTAPLAGRKVDGVLLGGAGAFELFVEGFPGGSPRETDPDWRRRSPALDEGREGAGLWGAARRHRVERADVDHAGYSRRSRQDLVAQPVLTLIDARTHFDITRDGSNPDAPGGASTTRLRLVPPSSPSISSKAKNTPAIGRVEGGGDAGRGAGRHQRAHAIIREGAALAKHWQPRLRRAAPRGFSASPRAPAPMERAAADDLDRRALIAQPAAGQRHDRFHSMPATP